MIESLHCFDNIIPLGDHCGPSIILKRLKIRKESYPFDWISHIDPVNNSILSIIIDIILKLLDTNNINHSVTTLLGNSLDKGNKFINNNHSIFFPHERGKKKNIQQKYIRRFKRLYENITDNSRNLYIIMHRNSEINFDLLTKLSYLLKTYNFNSEILLLSGKYNEIPINCKLVNLIYYKYNIKIGKEAGFDRLDREFFYKYFRTYLSKKLSKKIIYHSNNNLKCNNKIIIKKKNKKLKYKCSGHLVDHHLIELKLMKKEDKKID